MTTLWRIVIERRKGGHRFVMQERRLRFLWRTTSRSVVYPDLMDCLLELGRVCTRATMRTSGVHVRRKARRAFGRLASRLVIR